MEIKTEFIEISTRGHSDIVDITVQVQDFWPTGSDPPEGCGQKDVFNAWKEKFRPPHERILVCKPELVHNQIVEITSIKIEMATSQGIKKRSICLN